MKGANGEGGGTGQVCWKRKKTDEKGGRRATRSLKRAKGVEQGQPWRKPKAYPSCEAIVEKGRRKNGLTTEGTKAGGARKGPETQKLGGLSLRKQARKTHRPWILEREHRSSRATSEKRNYPKRRAFLWKSCSKGWNSGARKKFFSPLF